MTVARPDEDRFYLTCAAFSEQRMLDHLHAHRADAVVEIVNKSDTWVAIALQGPKSREVLRANTNSALDNASFRWLSAQSIDLTGQSMRAFRMSYADELGWAIHGSQEHLLTVYDASWSSGEPFGVADYGSFAMNAMRMEKAFKGEARLRTR